MSDPLDALSDLQIDVSAIRQIVVILLAQHALASDNPKRVLDVLEEAIDIATNQSLVGAASDEEVAHANSVAERTCDLIGAARIQIEAFKQENGSN